MRRAAKGRPRRGVALMLVLWLTVVVGAVAAAAATTMRAEMNAVSNLRAQAVGRYAAESGLAVATARIDSLLTAASTPEAWADLFQRLDARLGLQETAVGQARFAVAVTDVSARLDVNLATHAMLTALLAQFADRRQAERAVAAIEDWKDGDDMTRPNGAEVDAYVSAGSPFVPTNRPIRRLEELSRIAGIGDSLAAAVVPYLTVYGDGRININTAAEPVLASLPGMTPAAARALVSRREAGEVFTSAAPVMEQVGQNYFTTAYFINRYAIPIPSRLLIVSRGWMHGHPLTREIQAVYQVEGNRLRLQAWQERDR
jgi:general secretion pathway protein K